MRTVHRYEISQLGNDTELSLPAAANFVHLGTLQGSGLFLWFLIDVDAMLHKRRFRVLATGQAIPDNSNESLIHMGSYQKQLPGGEFVGHVFEVLPIRQKDIPAEMRRGWHSGKHQMQQIPREGIYQPSRDSNNPPPGFTGEWESVWYDNGKAMGPIGPIAERGPGPGPTGPPSGDDPGPKGPEGPSGAGELPAWLRKRRMGD